MLRLAFATALFALPACGNASEAEAPTAQPGVPAVATPTSTVVVDYVGTLEDGTEFDRGERVEFSLTRVVPGFRDGIAGMAEGESKRLVIPPEEGYGATGKGRVPPNATLIFEVTLHEVR